MIIDKTFLLIQIPQCYLYFAHLKLFSLCPSNNTCYKEQYTNENIYGFGRSCFKNISLTGFCADFMLKTKFSSSYKKVLLQYEFENLKDYVTPDEANKFFASLKQTNEEQGYELTYDEKSGETDIFKTTSSKAVYIFIGVLFFTASIVRWTQRK